MELIFNWPPTGSRTHRGHTTPDSLLWPCCSRRRSWWGWLWPSDGWTWSGNPAIKKKTGDQREKWIFFIEFIVCCSVVHLKTERTRRTTLPPLWSDFLTNCQMNISATWPTVISSLQPLWFMNESLFPETTSSFDLMRN